MHIVHVKNPHLLKIEKSRWNKPRRKNKSPKKNLKIRKIVCAHICMRTCAYTRNICSMGFWQTHIGILAGAVEFMHCAAILLWWSMGADWNTYGDIYVQWKLSFTNEAKLKIKIFVDIFIIYALIITISILSLQYNVVETEHLWI